MTSNKNVFLILILSVTLISCERDFINNIIYKFEGKIVDSLDNPISEYPIQMTYFNRGMDTPEFLPQNLEIINFNPILNRVKSDPNGTFSLYYPETKFEERKLLYATQNTQFQYMLGDSLVKRNYVIIPKNSIDFIYTIGTIKILNQ